MVNSVWTTIVIILCYYLTIWLLPKYMKNRSPFNLKIIMLVYNGLMVVVNSFIVVELALMSTKLNYSWTCQPITYVDENAELRIAKAIWLYYMSKLVEFLDTIFFILRKKDNQLTFLHVYHHSTMFLIIWLAIKYIPGGSAFLPILVNSFVHVVMYTYYALAIAYGNIFSKFRIYITSIQMAQFLMGFILGTNAIFNGCQWPLWLRCVFLFYVITMLILFGDFYRKNYIKKASARENEGGVDMKRI
ncbi:elongation of very long chain fatty acids protein 4-like isoform X2 [Adelges cooleyi]|nr:elongation of very long chain fatty acids protein 4-like isoform X2 [Adelges cooleyi]